MPDTMELFRYNIATNIAEVVYQIGANGTPVGRPWTMTSGTGSKALFGALCAIRPSQSNGFIYSYDPQLSGPNKGRNVHSFAGGVNGANPLNRLIPSQ